MTRRFCCAARLHPGSLDRCPHKLVLILVLLLLAHAAARGGAAGSDEGVCLSPRAAYCMSGFFLVPAPNTSFLRGAGSGVTLSSARPPPQPLVAGGVSELCAYVQTVSHYGSGGRLAWSARLGSGGQLYSLQAGSGREYIGAAPQGLTGQFQDRVWQQLFSSSSTSLLTAYGRQWWWATQSGSYSALQPGSGTRSFPPGFSQAVAQWYDAGSRTFHMLSLPQQPVTADWTQLPERRAFEVHALLQTSLRDLGDVSPTISGFEYTAVLTQFGPQTIDQTGLWSGFDPASLGNRWDALDNASRYAAVPQQLRWDQSAAQFAHWGGWSAYADNRNGSGAVFGFAVQLNASSPRSGPFSMQLGINDNTSYILAQSLEGYLHPESKGRYIVQPGQSYWARHYVLFGSAGVDDFSRVADSIVSESAGSGRVTVRLSRARLLQNCSALEAVGLLSACLFWALDSPAFHPVPLLLIQHRHSGLVSISTDPYLYAPIHTADLLGPTTLHVTAVLGFLGWAIKYSAQSAAPPCPGWALLSQLLSWPTYDDPAQLGVDAWVSASAEHRCPDSALNSSAPTPPTFRSIGLFADPAPAPHPSYGGDGIWSSNATLSGQVSAVLNVSELSVFAHELSHVEARPGQQPYSWTLRLGSGGQIYHLQDSARTQLVGLPWNAASPFCGASAWQPVWGASTGLMLQSCIPGDAVTQQPPFFAPLIGWEDEQWAGRFSMISWPQPSHCADAGQASGGSCRSYVLQQTSVRDLGDVAAGVSGFEVTWLCTNYGNSTIDDVTLLSAALARSSSAFRWDSNATSGLWNAVNDTAHWSTPNPAAYNGWSAYASSNDSSGAVIAVVAAPSPASTPAAPFTVGLGASDARTTRHVVSTSAPVPAGHTLFYRFFVLFAQRGVQALAEAANALSRDSVAYGERLFPLSLAQPSLRCDELDKFGFPCLFWALSTPVPNAVPLLILQSLPGLQCVISTDPYRFGLASGSTERTTAFKAFLGWAVPVSSEQPPRAGLVRLSGLLPARLFDDGGGRDAWVEPRLPASAAPPRCGWTGYPPVCSAPALPLVNLPATSARALDLMGNAAELAAGASFPIVQSWRGVSNASLISVATAPTKAWTLALWFYSLVSAPYALSAYPVRMTVDGAGSLSVSAPNGSLVLSTPPLAAVNQWLHVSLAYSLTGLRCFLNGSLVAEARSPPQLFVTEPVIRLSSAERRCMRWLQLYPFPLSPQQARDLFMAQLVAPSRHPPPSPARVNPAFRLALNLSNMRNGSDVAGAVADASGLGGSFTVISSSGAWSVVQDPLGVRGPVLRRQCRQPKTDSDSMQLVGPYGAVPSLWAERDFSLAVWVQPTAFNYLNNLLSECGGNQLFIGVSRRVWVSDYSIFSQRSPNYYASTYPILRTNDWQFVLVAYAGNSTGDWSIFLDGVRLPLQTTGYRSPQQSWGQGVCMGVSQYGDCTAFEGYMDGLTLYDRVLSDAEVAIMYRQLARRRVQQPSLT